MRSQDDTGCAPNFSQVAVADVSLLSQEDLSRMLSTIFVQKLRGKIAVKIAGQDMLQKNGEVTE